MRSRVQKPESKATVLLLWSGVSAISKVIKQDISAVPKNTQMMRWPSIRKLDGLTQKGKEPSLGQDKCLRVLLLWEDNMTKATLLKENISLGLAYSFRGSVHYHHGGMHGGWQAGRHGAGEGAERSISGSTGRRKRQRAAFSLA